MKGRITPTHFMQQYNWVDKNVVERNENFSERPLPIAIMNEVLEFDNKMTSYIVVAIWKIKEKPVNNILNK